MKNSHISLRRLSGVNAVLGLDVSESRARVVELVAKGGFLKPDFLRLVARSSFEVEFGPVLPAAERGGLIAKALKEKNVRTRRAVCAISQAAVRTSRASIPTSTERIDEWIEEHAQALLRIPAPLSELNYRYETLSEDADSRQVEVSFVRKADILKVLELAEAAGLELLGISAGVGDLARLVPPSTARPQILVHSGEKAFVVGEVEKSRWSQKEMHPAIELNAFLERSRSSEAPRNMILAGDLPPEAAKLTSSLTPYGLPPQLALAAALAARGFDEVRRVDFLPPKLVSNLEASLSKNLLQRLVIACGIALMVLLAIPMAMNLYLQSRIEGLDANLGSSRTQESELIALERQVENLESQLHGGKASSRSRIAETLHDLASHTPDGVWLYRLKIGEKSERAVRLHGYARSNDAVTAYLKDLDKAEGLAGVSLVREGYPVQDEPVEQMSKRIPGMVTFEIKADTR